MKKSNLTSAILIAGLLAASQLTTSCNGNKEQSKEEATDQMKADSTQTVYACPMHPEITGKEGEKCSKCGMALVAVKSADTTKTQHDH